MKTASTSFFFPSARAFAVLGTAALFAACQREDVAPTSLPAAHAATEPAVTVGRVGYWKFDGNANDALSSRNGAVTSGTYEAGVAGQALRFSGSTYVDLPKGLVSSGQGSVSLWVKTTHSSGILFYGTSQTGGNGFGSEEELHLNLSNGRPQLFIEGTGSTGSDFILTANQTINDGHWHHVVATWQNATVTGLSETLLYVDGQIALANAAFEDGAVYNNAKVFSFSQLMRLGRPATAAASYQGLLDDVVVYNRPIDSDEVEVLLRTAGGRPLEYVVDNTDGSFFYPFDAGAYLGRPFPTTPWRASSALRGFHGSNYLHDGSVGTNPNELATWYSPITEAGTYDVYMKWTSEADRPDQAPVQVKHKNGVANLTVNQKVNGGRWNKIGTWDFEKYDASTFVFDESNGYVRITGADAGYTIADAVRWVKVSSAARQHDSPSTFYRRGR